MKVPKVFLPDHDVEHITSSLLNQPETIDLEDLILKEDSGFSNLSSQGNLPAEYYPNLDESKIDEAVYVNYTSQADITTVDIIKFKDEEYLTKYMDKIKGVIKSYNSGGRYDLCTLVKDKYVMLIYAESKDPRTYNSLEEDFKTRIVNFYKERFGFKEVE